MSRSVLLIDSDKSFERLLASELGDLDLEVRQCPPNQDALAQIGVLAPVAIVIAVEEPDKAGFLLCNRAKKGPAAAIPVVMATKTVAASDFAAHRKLKVHADQYVDKRQLASGDLAACFRALLAHAEAAGSFAHEFDVVQTRAVAGISDLANQLDANAAYAVGTGVVEEPEMVVESGEFEAVDELEQIVEEHRAKADAAPAPPKERDEDEAFAALGDFSFEDGPRRDEATQLPEVITAVAPNTALLAMNLSPDHAAAVDEFSEDLATNFETDNAVSEVEPQDSLAIPTAEAARLIPSIPVRSATAPPPFRPSTIPPPRSPTAPPPFAVSQDPAEFADTPQSLEIEAIPEPLPTPNRALESSRFDLGLDEVAAWATEEKSQISDRKALSRAADLERENTRLLAELDRLRAEAAERSGESARVFLRDQSQEHVLRLAQLQDELADARDTLATYEASRLTKDQAIADLTAKKAAADAALADATSRLVQGQQALSEANLAADRAKTQLAELTVKVAEMNATLTAAARGEQTRQSEREAAHADELAKRAAAEADLRASHDELLAKHDELLAKHDELLAKHRDLQEEYGRTREQLAAAQAATSTASASASHHADELAKLHRAKRAVAIALTILDET